LCGRWALVFSHADDFLDMGLEADRWLVQMKSAFTAAFVRPIALSTSPATWIAQVGGATANIEAAALFPNAAGPDATAREAVNQSGRFVSVMNAHMQPKRTFTYRGSTSLPSPLELLGMANAMQQAACASDVDPRHDYVYARMDRR